MLLSIDVGEKERVVKEFVELHHGTVGVESRDGEGSTFIVYLPLGKDHLRNEEIIDSSESFDELTLPAEHFITQHGLEFEIWLLGFAIQMYFPPKFFSMYSTSSLSL